MTDPTDIPFLKDMTHVRRYADCQQIFVSPRVCEVDPLETYSADLWHDTLPIINNEPHLARRRYLAPIFSREATSRYDEQVLEDAIRECLDECASDADETGSAEIELMSVVKLMLIRIAAVYIGIDDIMGNRDRARELIRVVGTWTVGTQARYSMRPRDEVISEALVALREYVEAFYEPSRARRQALVERYVRGELAAEDLPKDVVTFQLRPERRDLWTDETAILDTLPMLAGGLHTTASSIARCIDEYFAWREQNGERELDGDMIRALVNETLRLFPPVAYIVRKAVADLALRSGWTIPAGTEIALVIDEANRDADVFGADSDAFRPDRFRELPPHTPQYGLAFGAGPHLCIGRPLVTTAGSDTRETKLPRVMNRIVEALLAHGVDRPSLSAPTREPSYRDILKTYPVRLTGLAPAGAL
jgi:cytochrome P450